MFIDVYVDDDLMLVRHLPTYPDRCFGLHARGGASFRDFTAVRYVRPEVFFRTGSGGAGPGTC